MPFRICVAQKSHTQHAQAICDMMASAAQVRGTGIAKREPQYIQQKMLEGKAIIALDGDQVVGFCYIESWENQKYVANSGLIIHPDYRKMGLARAIKQAIFKLSKELFPKAQLFGITTSLAVMKINSNLGYKPVAFSELTSDEKFWSGCSTCPNYDILQRTQKTMCICTGMLCDLSTPSQPSNWEAFKQFIAKRKNQIKNKARLFPKLNKLINHEK